MSGASRERHDERPGEHGAAAEPGIVDQQDALKSEVESEQPATDQDGEDA